MIKSFSTLKLFELLENTELISHRGGDPADAETGERPSFVNARR